MLKLWKVAGFGLVLSVLLGSPQGASADGIMLVSGMGGKCLDVEGGSIRQGTRIIGYNCNGQANQHFEYNQGSGEIKINGLCVDAAGGRGGDGDQLVLWDCHGGQNQKWRLDASRLVGINGKCVDLKGGAGHWFGNQEAILWGCHGGTNQKWYAGKVVPASQVSGATVIQPGQQIDVKPTSGANVVAMGGMNVIAAGGANVVAIGGGNVVAMGGMN